MSTSGASQSVVQFGRDLAGALARFSVPSRRVPASFAVGVVLVASAFAVLIAASYTTGDAGPYTALFDQLASADIDSILFWQRCITASHEPVYSLVAWVFGHAGLSRLAFIGSINVILVIVLALWLWKNDAPWPTWLLLFSNYYLLALLGSADRLKMSILLLLAALVVNLPWQRAALVVLGVNAHSQGAMLFGAWLCGHLPRLTPFLRQNRRLVTIGAAVALGLAGALLVASWDVIGIKLKVYWTISRGPAEAIDFLVLTAIGLLAARDRLRVVLTQLPLMLLAVMLGNSRMTIIGFFLLIEQMVEEKRTGHPVVILLMAFASYKSIDFIASISATGNGFWDTNPYFAPSYGPCLDRFGR
jgi:hypothetical protein